MGLPCNYCFREFFNYEKLLEHEKKCKASRDQAVKTGRIKSMVNLFRGKAIDTTPQQKGEG